MLMGGRIEPPPLPSLPDCLPSVLVLFCELVCVADGDVVVELDAFPPASGSRRLPCWSVVG
jgi:hypothetical protein